MTAFVRTLARCALAHGPRGRGGRALARAGLSLPPRHHRGRLDAGRNQRSARAHDRRAAQRRLGPVGHRRQPVRRRRQYRRRLCRARAGRRLHADGRHRRDDDQQRLSLQEHAVRSGEGLRADHQCRGEHHLPRGPCRVAGQFGGGADRLCQGQSGQAATTARPASARRIISPASCCARRPASTSSTSPIAAAARPSTICSAATSRWRSSASRPRCRISPPARSRSWRWWRRPATRRCRTYRPSARPSPGFEMSSWLGVLRAGRHARRR